MKYALLIILFLSLTACGDKPTESAAENKATELRDWAESHTSRAEITTKLAEAKMTLRVVAQADPQSEEAKKLKEKIADLEKQLKELENNARQ